MTPPLSENIWGFEWNPLRSRSQNNLQKIGRCENPEYGGISRNMAEYHGIWRNITKYHDIFPEYTGTSQNVLMVAMRLFINMDV
jgi:hypothetical protein